MYSLSAADADPKEAVLAAGIAALPACRADTLNRCLNHDNVDGLPPADCAAITRAYDLGGDFEERIDQVVRELPICEPPVFLIAVGAAVAGGLLTYLVVR